MKRIFALSALLLVGAALPAAAQMGGRLSIQPYVGYGFFGSLPENGPTLEAAVAYGARGAYQISEQFALFGNFQRSEPPIEGLVERKARVDHWSAGTEFSYVPRGGAEGMLPILLEVGVGQARYDFRDGLRSASESDMAVNIGLASALQLSPNFAIRYGANDYISKYADIGYVNQIFVQVGAELKM